VNPSQDAFVSAANPTLNYGAAGALEVSASGSPNGQFDSLLQFDLTTAKSTLNSTFGANHWAITGITLQLGDAGPNNPLFNPSAAGAFTIKWMKNDGWVEGIGTPKGDSTSGITFATLPSFLSSEDVSLGNFAFDGGTTGLNIWALALASAFAADVQTDQNVSFLMLPADQSVSYLSHSRDFGSDPPILSITAIAVPEPAAASLLLAGASVLSSRRRRRHARKG
jgi:hypothetical protein